MDAANVLSGCASIDPETAGVGNAPVKALTPTQIRRLVPGAALPRPGRGPAAEFLYGTMAA